MGKAVEVKFKMDDFLKRFKDKQKSIQIFIAAQMQFNRSMLFNNEGAYNGRPRWAPLKLRSGMILSDTGKLRKSMTANMRGDAGSDGIVYFRGDTITIGTKVAYARLMNDGTTKMPGGVLRPTTGKALMIPLPSGKNATDTTKSLKKGSKKIVKEGEKTKNVIFRKSVKIPARPFDTWTQEDEEELNAALLNKVAEVLNAKN